MFNIIKGGSLFIFFIFLYFLCPLSFANNVQPKTLLYAVSKGYDHIGGGGGITGNVTYNLSEIDGIFNTKSLPWILNNPLGEGVLLTIKVNTNDPWKNFWSLEFRPPENQSFEIGKLYKNVEISTLDKKRDPENPEMNISLGLNHCSQVSGNFIVLELNKDKDDTIKSLAIDFEQICMNATILGKYTPAGLLVGSIRFNSVIPPKTLPKNTLTVDVELENSQLGNGEKDKKFHFFSEEHSLMVDTLFKPNTISLFSPSSLSPLKGYEFMFSTAKNELWHVGKYENVENYPQGSDYNAGLLIRDQSGNSCSSSNSNFEVLEINYDKDNGTIEKLALDFEQRCISYPGRVWGSIRYNSEIPPAIKQ